MNRKYKPDLLFITHAVDSRIPTDVVIFNYFPCIAWASRLLGDDRWYGDWLRVDLGTKRVSDKMNDQILSECIDILVSQIGTTRMKLREQNA